jgi:DNA polymerase/3'-5' exonuclease PolX
MFGVETMEPHQLDTVDWTQYGRMVKGGHKYKQIELSDGINLDLFIVTPPAQFGIQFLIRTGSAEFSHKFVTARQYGGFMPGYLKVKDGAIWSNNHVIETPEELDVFNLAGMPYISPELRTL